MEKSNDKIRQIPNTKPKSRKDKHKIPNTESLSKNHTKKAKHKKNYLTIVLLRSLGSGPSPITLEDVINNHQSSIITNTLVDRCYPQSRSTLSKLSSFNTLVDLRVTFYFIFMKTVLTSGNFLTYQKS